MVLILPFLFGLLAIIQLWLLILVCKDIFKSQFKAGSVEKNIWYLVVIFIPMAGAIIYLIFREDRKRNKNRNGILQ